MAELLHSLGIEWHIIIAQIVNFAILLAVLLKFVYHPVTRLLDERKKEAEDTLTCAKEVKEALASSERAREKVLDEARLESVRIIELAKKQGEGTRQKILVTAKEAADRMYRDNEKKIAAEKIKLIADVRKEIGGLITEAIERSFGDVLDDRAQGKMVEQAFAVIRGEDTGAISPNTLTDKK